MISFCYTYDMTNDKDMLSYDDSLMWLSQQLKFGIKPGIERMKWLLNELGNPQEKVKGVHVVGTNGKGSTVHYLQTILTESGYEVGTFTSPYIMDFRERISLDGQMISKEDLVRLVKRVKPLAERLPKETGYEPATEFELITTMMFLYFGEVHPVDIAIIEAGLGGLYDSTNVFIPLAVVCPSIGLDHQSILGYSYQEIAKQKVGVLKHQVPFVFSEQRSDVKSVFYKKASETNSPVHELGRDFTVSGTAQHFDFKDEDKEMIAVSLKMFGQHQVANAGLAIKTSLLLADSYQGVSEESIRQGLQKASWLGRTELISSNLMIDGAHNKESVTVLTDLLAADFSDKNIQFLFSAIDTKPVDEMLNQLSTLGHVTVTSFEYPNAVLLENYPEQYPRVPHFQKWLASCDLESPDSLYVITGSLYFVSQVRQYLLARK